MTSPDAPPAETTAATPAAPPNYPPPTVPAAPPREQPPGRTGSFRQGFGLGTGLGLGLLMGLIALSVIAGLFGVIAAVAALGSQPAAGASGRTETVWGSPAAAGKLRAITISGPIMTSEADGGLLVSGTYGYEVADTLDKLTAADAGAVVLLVNTPGGSITGSKAISDAIERYQKRTGKKVFVHVEGMSASGGVYSTAPADEIIADHGSIVGSIGVIFGPIEHYKDVVATSGTILQQGVTTTGGITSEYITAGTGKDVGNPYRPMTEADRAMLKAIIDPEYQRFVEHVSTHRDISASTITGELGAGMFEPGKAQAIGLIDATMGRDEFFRHAATQAGLDPDQTQVVTAKAPSAFEALLGMTRAYGASAPVTAKPGTVVSASFCGTTSPLVFAGPLSAVCG